MGGDILVMHIRFPVPEGYKGIRIMRPAVLSNPFFLSNIKDDAKRSACLLK
jgi:hypothetical protein